MKYKLNAAEKEKIILNGLSAKGSLKSYTLKKQWDFIIDIIPIGRKFENGVIRILG